jgi:hypothetical protein
VRAIVYYSRMTPLFHVSETPDIARFDPRPDDRGNLVVWAIDLDHLPNYLLPRDCPRVCARRTRDIHAQEIEELLLGQDHAIYVETAWRDRIRRAELFCYAFRRQAFACVDENAGYFQSSESVSPLGFERIVDCEAHIASHGVALRYVESLWPIQDFAVQSTLVYSCIRMRNATPRT